MPACPCWCCRRFRPAEVCCPESAGLRHRIEPVPKPTRAREREGVAAASVDDVQGKCLQTPCTGDVPVRTVSCNFVHIPCITSPVNRPRLFLRAYADKYLKLRSDDRIIALDKPGEGCVVAPRCWVIRFCQERRLPGALCPLGVGHTSHAVRLHR